MMDGPGTYRILPGFITDDDPSLAKAVNGWNDHLERWLLDMQHECNRHYVMLLETARALRIWKWVFIVFNIALASSGLLATAIAVPMGETGIWLPIYNAVAAVLGAGIFTLYETMDFNNWGSDCRNSAGEFIILGRNIESVKRVPRLERDRPGLLYANDSSITFETIRANMPPILGYVQKRHQLPPTKQSRIIGVGAGDFSIPLEYLKEIHEAETARHDECDDDEHDSLEHESSSSRSPVDNARGEHGPEGPKGPEGPDVPLAESDGKEKDESPTKAVPVMSEMSPRGPRSSAESKKKSTVALQDLFMARLEMVETMQEENDDLANYENYIRSQYRALANDPILSRGAGPVMGATPTSTPRGYVPNGSLPDRRSSVLFARSPAGTRSSITRQKQPRAPRAQKKRK